MKTYLLAIATMFVSAPGANFTNENSVVLRGDMQIDRIVDYTNPENPIVCYMAQHHNGSSHTTPAIYCLKLYR